MDQELIDLLARLNDETNPLSDEELTDLHEKIVAIASDIDPATASDDDIAVLTEAADHARSIQEQIDTRATAAAERAARAEELRSAILPKDEDGTVDGETPAEGDAPAEGDQPAETPSEPPAADQPANPPAPENPAAPAELPANDPAVEGGARAEESAQPVAASATPAPQVPRISRLAHRTPRTHAPVKTATESGKRPVLLASADIPGLPAGEPVSLEQFAQGAARKMETFARMRSSEGDGEKISFGRIVVDYPEDRILDMNETLNQEKIDKVTSQEALVASGGICAPVAADYNVAGVSQAGRPVRDGMAQFGANRGGVRYVLPATLVGVTAQGPASVWTAANDANPTSPTTKPHATFVCQPVQETFVDAIPSIVQFGNFASRYFPEQIAQFLETVDAVHARLAEGTLLAAMHTGSTQATTGPNLLGTASDLLAELDRAASAMRYRHRMAPESALRFVMPEWLEDNIRADLARELPGNSGGQSERLAVADAQIANFFAVRNINLTYAQDAPSNDATQQGFVGQGNGLLLPWPTKVRTWLYPEGSWTFLDGGELDLGMVRDSTLNSTNNFQMFSETFEKAVFRGVESLEILFDICPSGQRANTVDTSTYCASGS